MQDSLQGHDQKILELSKRIHSLDDFVRFKYPEPGPDSRHFAFFEQWGYEQYLIHRFEKSLEQLKVLLSGKYATFVGLAVPLARHGGDFDAAFAGRPLVKAKAILDGFMMPRCPKGWHGILLEDRSDGNHLCFMVSKGGGATPLLRVFNDREVEKTEHVYESQEKLMDLCPPGKVASPFELENQWFEIPGRGRFYCWSVKRHGRDGCLMTIARVADVCKTKPKLKRPRKSTASEEIFTISDVADFIAIWAGWLDGRVAPVRKYGGEK